MVPFKTHIINRGIGLHVEVELFFARIAPFLQEQKVSHLSTLLEDIDTLVVYILGVTSRDMVQLHSKRTISVIPNQLAVYFLKVFLGRK